MSCNVLVPAVAISSGLLITVGVALSSFCRAPQTDSGPDFELVAGYCLVCGFALLGFGLATVLGALPQFCLE
jgi:hypothetical protein